MLCISRFLSEKSVLRENRKLGSNHTVKFSKGTWHHKKIAKERVHCGAFESVNLTRAIRAPPSLRGGNKTKPCIKKDAPAEWHATWREVSISSKIRIKLRFYSLLDARATLAPTSKSPEEREFVVDSGASMHMLSKKVLSSDEMETLRRSRNTTTVVTASGEVQTNEEAQVFDLDLFVTVQILDDTPAVLSLGKTLRRTRIYL